MKKKSDSAKFKFSLDITLESPSLIKAREHLLKILEDSGINIYQINDAQELTNSESQQQNIDYDNSLPDNIYDLIEKYKTKNSLVRLKIVKGKGQQLSIPCRILNWDTAKNTITVYHVDEKRVYNFHLSEIDDFAAS